MRSAGAGPAVASPHARPIATIRDAKIVEINILADPIRLGKLELPGLD
jgi:hypothetical protein